MKSRTNRRWGIGLCAAIAIGIFSANTCAMEDPASESKSYQKPDPIMQTGILFSAVLESAVAGPVAQSYPPIYTHTLTLVVKEVFRGDLTPGQTLTAGHQARQHEAPVFPVKKLCVVAVSDVRGHFNVDYIQEATKEQMNKARMAGKIPHGWKMTGDRFISPWAAMGQKFWPKNAPALKADQPVCSKTGRPVLLVGQGVAFTVEPVPPVKKIEWTNPDGDGLYKLTVTNTSNQPREVAALLIDGEKILWNESVVILSQNIVQPPALCARQIPKTVRPIMLEPGQSVSGELNVFGLKGIEWPQGGDRIEFLFCLGEKSVKQSFYYLSRHHDKIRNQAPVNRPDNRYSTASPDQSSARPKMHPSWDQNNDGINDCEDDGTCDDSVDYTKPRPD